MYAARTDARAGFGHFQPSDQFLENRSKMGGRVRKRPSFAVSPVQS